MSEELAPPTLRVRCPHCRKAIEVLEDTELTNVSCPSCDSRFDLVADETLNLSNGIPEHFGRFELLGLVGTGGFGSVWRCRDPELDRIVALKLPRKEQVGGSAEQFLREARAAAQLKHPNIVTVHEVGREDDRVYIVSDFVEGVDLASRLRHERLTSRETAELCARIADALDHAHESGIVHRDLKPSNVLLDAGGEPYLTDFGLAKRDADEITITVAGKIVGTPAYMSPEQASGNAHTADRRTDVYSLGAVLFEMLCGEKPFRGDSQMLLYQVVHEEAPSPRRLNAAVSRDLEVICLKCLEKEPRRRYQTAHELADDLRRFLRGEPIEARRITRMERSWRWACRNPILASLAAALALSLFFGFLAVSWQWIRAEGEIEAKRRFVYSADMNVALDAWRQGRVDRVLALLERHSGPGDADLRGFEWDYLRHEVEPALETLTVGTSDPVLDLEYSPDGETLAAAGVVSQLTLRDARTAEIKATLVPESGEMQNIVDIAFSPDGDLLASAGSAGVVRLWDTSTGRERQALRGHSDRVYSVSFSPDGMQLASASWDGSVRVWNVASGDCAEVLTHHGGRVDSVAFSPDGRTLATGGKDGSIAFLDATDGFEPRRTRLRHLAAVDCLAYSPRGDILASGSDDHSIILWDASTGEVLTVLRGHTAEIEKLDFTADGTMLASAGHDNVVRLWDVKTRRLLRDLRGHSTTVYCLAFSSDGATLATGSTDSSIRFWTIDRTAALDRIEHGATVWSIAFSPTGELMATSGDSSVVRLFDPRTGGMVRNLSGHESLVRSVAFSGDGNVLASGGIDGTVRIWDVRTGETARVLRVGDGRHRRVRSGVASDGSAGRESDVDPEIPAARLSRMVVAIALAPDGRLVAETTGAGIVQLWSTVTGRLVHTLVDSTRPTDRSPSYHGLAFSPDGKVLAVAVGRVVEIFDVASGQRLGTLGGEDAHAGAVWSLAFSPDGKTLASGGDDATLVLWDLATRSARSRSRGHVARIWCVAFSPVGDRVATCSMDKTVMLWDAGSGEERGVLFQSGRSVMVVAFSHDGTTIAATDGFDAVRLWRAPRSDENPRREQLR